MKKKTLVVLLIIPFIIGLLSFVSVVILNNTVAADISAILWDYKDNEGFKISKKPYELKAKAVIDDDILLAPGNELTWKLKNVDNSNKEYASLYEEDGKFYLTAKQEGQVRLTCQNKRGTVSRHFNAFIYEKGTILVNRGNQSSGSNIDEKYYLGQYDFDGDGKRLASFDAVTELLEGKSEIFIQAETPNIEVVGKKINVRAAGPATMKLYTTVEPFITIHYTFEIVENGYNVYCYDDLLKATNLSKDNKNVVLQTNLESLKNTYKVNEGKYVPQKLDGKENTQLFGNYDFEKQKFNFENEFVKFESNYNTKFIDQFNKATEATAGKDIIAGINLHGDLYGNGYTINAHDLAFPTHGEYGLDGKLTPDPYLDYFHGPLGYVSIGDLEKMSVVKAYGQDNVLLYVNGDNLTINDVKIRNSNEIDNMYDLIYTGSVVDINGHNNTIKNSIISNGRTVIRAFDADGLKIENCILKNAAEFIMKVGSTKINPYQEDKEVKVNYKGQEYKGDFKSFFDINNDNAPGNLLLNEYLTSPAITNKDEVKEIMSTLKQVQDAFTNLDGIKEGEKINYADTIDIKHTYFYNSGIFALAFESMFNGPYLYNAGPSTVKEAISLFQSVPPEKIGGTSYPVLVNMDKSSKFYDWKAAETIDASILIEEHIVQIVKELFGKDLEMEMDDYFPMKSLLKNKAGKAGYVYYNEDKSFVNSKVAFFGGGANLSKLNIADEDIKEMDLSNEIEVNITEAVTSGDHISTAHSMILLLAKCVSMATGFNPFRFITNNVVNGKPSDFDTVPQVDDLLNYLN